jgi:diacylglycerol O-acyltransferase
MQQVVGMERVFLGLESDDYPMDGAALLILDPATAEGGYGFDAVRAAFQRGLPRTPVLTRKVVEAPTPVPGSGPAYWVEDPDFDLDAHLGRIIVSAPGDRAALAELTVRLSEGGQLPRDRPLWRAWYVDGVADGLAAVIVRFHHAAVDGIAAVEMFGALLDLEPRPAPKSVAATDDHRRPGATDILLRSVRDVALMPAIAAKDAATLAIGLAAGQWAARKAPRAALPDAGPSLFDRASSSPEKSLGLLELPFAEVKAVKNALGVSLTDVVLAMVTASLRQYLMDRGDPVDNTLSALCPINARSGKEQSGAGNHWAMMFNSLPIHLADPLEQLAAIQRETATNKRVAYARAEYVNPADAVAGIVPPVTWPIVRKIISSPLGGYLPPIANLTVSSIPGAPMPLYLAGAKVLHMHNRAFTQPGAGLFVAYVGYCDSLDVGITATRELVPDPEKIAAGMREHLALLGTLALSADREASSVEEAHR